MLDSFSTPIALVGLSAEGWCMSFHGRHPVADRLFTSEGEAAEHAVLSRDEGGWHLRYDLGAEVIERAVAEIDATNALPRLQLVSAP